MNGFIERVSDIDSFCGQKGIGHGAADYQRLDLPHQVFEECNLGRNLCAPDHRHQGTLGIVERLMKME